MLAKCTLLLDLAINKKSLSKANEYGNNIINCLQFNDSNCNLIKVVSNSFVRVPMKEISRTKKYKKVRKNIVGLVFHRHVVGPI